ncbi:MAG: ATP-binding protein [Paracoccaceae bacterium]
MAQAYDIQGSQNSRRRKIRIALAVAIVMGVVLVWASNTLLTQRFTAGQRNVAAVRATLLSGSVASILQRHSVVPLLMVRDPFLISALQSKDFTTTSQRLIDLRKEIGAGTITLADIQGHVVASSERQELGTTISEQPYINAALRAKGTVFSVVPPSESSVSFVFARKIADGSGTLGVIVVGVDLRRVEDRWRRSGFSVVVTDSEQKIILASRPAWRNLTVDQLISDNRPQRVRLPVGTGGSVATGEPQVYLDGTARLRAESRVGFEGWRLTYFAPLDNVRARVDAVLALEIMAIAVITATGLYFVSRRLAKQQQQMRRESEELRALNARLTAEIIERERVERTLQVTEQSLEQASKLAALGQMSAAVSHELNQPLAAMRTYLAGARLLMQRKRIDEALASFQRIDDLTDRMGSITRQLKSYARKGGDELQPLDLRQNVNSALAMMAPQLRQTSVTIEKDMPSGPVMVMGDVVRLEQILINLIRNAIDATRSSDAPKIEVVLTPGETVRLEVRDNGVGIDNPEELFEPFYTTKKPGEGLGLGLAISAGIASDLNGRLVARNRAGGGAVFELQLPRLAADNQAAE